MMADVAKLNSLSIRYNKFKAMLELPNIDLGAAHCVLHVIAVNSLYPEQLKKLSWSGIPEEIRPTVWKLLMVWS